MQTSPRLPWCNVGRAAHRRGNATFGLRYGSDDGADMVSRTITHEPLIVIAAADHRLAYGKSHSPAALTGERWVTFQPRASS